MDIAPDPYLKSYLKVLEKAISQARFYALKSQNKLLKGFDSKHHENLADLLDAIHVIPELLNQWSRCNEPSLRNYLEEFDKKWVRSENDFSLVKTFDDEFKKK